MSYSFLRESKLYLVYGGTKYNIRTTSSITFNQTITKANPASFSFVVPFTVEKDESIVIDLLGDLVETTDSGITTQQLKSFDMYVQTGSSTFKLENAVITSGSFNFGAREQFVLELEGQGTKLSRVGDESFSIPGSAQSESSTRTPLIVYPVLTVDSLDMSSILSTTLQIQNQIEFTPFETLHNSLSVTDSSNAMFPSTYTLGMRVASGEIRQYQTDNNVTQFDDFNTSSNLTIKAVQVGNPSSDSGFFSINLNPISYTARVQPEDVYVQSYDYTSTDNTALGTRITQYS
jgi:hypothetical protein